MAPESRIHGAVLNVCIVQVMDQMLPEKCDVGAEEEIEPI